MEVLRKNNSGISILFGCKIQVGPTCLTPLRSDNVPKVVRILEILKLN